MDFELWQHNIWVAISSEETRALKKAGRYLGATTGSIKRTFRELSKSCKVNVRFDATEDAVNSTRRPITRTVRMDPDNIRSAEAFKVLTLLPRPVLE